ncbi:MAG TPA: hypothetical protein PLQ57_04235 [Saprospiraceae bacterium]|nr:hypothetical protein [Saprospiraceae bacterium]
MKIALTIPGFSAHGGINVILEWANRLSEFHEVTLITSKLGKHQWYPLDKAVKVTTDIYLKKYDCLIVCSPHHSFLLESKHLPEKCFVFMQMLEDKFKPQDISWQRACKEFYNSKFPMFYISEWNYKEIKRSNDQDVYLGNGVNFDLFPLEDPIKENVILVEGWEPGNPTKDVDYIGARVAKELKKLYGCKVLAYSQLPCKEFMDVPDEYHVKPNLETLNSLYRRAKIFIKATKCDARSTAPLEAATKNCIVVRGIDKGDDDLFVENCYKIGYNYNQVLSAAIQAFDNPEKAKKKAEELQSQIRIYDWFYWMAKVREIIE